MKHLLRILVSILVIFFLVGCANNDAYQLANLPAKQIELNDTIDLTQIKVEQDGVILDDATVEVTPNQIDTSTAGVKEILIEVLIAEEVIYSQTYTFEVLDTISSRKPVINGLRDFTYIIGEQTDITEFYLKEGVKVEDTYYGDITGNLVIDHNIDLSKVGVYQVIYKAENIDGYQAYETVNFEVKLIDETLSFGDAYAIVGKNGQYGVLNLDGHVAVEPTFDQIYNLGDDIIKLRKNNQYYYFDLNKEDFVTFDYEPEAFHLGVSRVYSSQLGKYGYINKNNDLIVDFIYDQAGTFNEMGLAIVGYQGYTENYRRSSTVLGVINTSGEEIVPIKYSKIDIYLSGDTLNDIYYYVETSDRFTYYLLDSNLDIKHHIFYDAIDEVVFNDQTLYMFENENGRLITDQKFDPYVPDDIDGESLYYLESNFIHDAYYNLLMNNLGQYYLTDDEMSFIKETQLTSLNGMYIEENEDYFTFANDKVNLSYDYDFNLLDSTTLEAEFSTYTSFSMFSIMDHLVYYSARNENDELIYILFTYNESLQSQVNFEYTDTYYANLDDIEYYYYNQYTDNSYLMIDNHIVDLNGLYQSGQQINESLYFFQVYDTIEARDRLSLYHLDDEFIHDNEFTDLFLYDNFFITLNADGTTYDLYDYQGELLIDDALDISELTNDLLKVIFNDTLDNYVHLFNLASKTFDDESYSDAMMVMDNQYIYVEKIDQDDTLSGIIDLNFEEKHPLALQSYDSLVGNYLFYVKDTIEYIYHIPSETFIDLESDEIIDIANDLIIALPNGEISNQLFDENGLILTHEAYQTIMNDNTATLNHITYAHDQYYVINDASTDVLIYDYDQDQSYVFDNLEELNYQQSNDDMFLFSGPTDPSVSYLFMLDHANQIMTSTYEPVSTSGEFDGSYFIDRDDSQLYYKFDSINFYSYANYYIFDDQKHFTLYSQTYSEFYVVDENDNIIKISDYLGEFLGYRQIGDLYIVDVFLSDTSEHREFLMRKDTNGSYVYAYSAPEILYADDHHLVVEQYGDVRIYRYTGNLDDYVEKFVEGPVNNFDVETLTFDYRGFSIQLTSNGQYRVDQHNQSYNDIMIDDYFLPTGFQYILYGMTSEQTDAYINQETLIEDVLEVLHIKDDYYFIRYENEVCIFSISQNDVIRYSSDELLLMISQITNQIQQSYYAYVIDGNMGIINSDSEIIIEARYGSIWMHEDYFIARNKGTYTLYDLDGEKLHESVYHHVDLSMLEVETFEVLLPNTAS